MRTPHDLNTCTYAHAVGGWEDAPDGLAQLVERGRHVGTRLRKTLVLRCRRLEVRVGAAPGVAELNLQRRNKRASLLTSVPPQTLRFNRLF